MVASEVLVLMGELLARYRFPDGHPFSIDRQRAFWDEARRQGLDRRVVTRPPRTASVDELLRFHTAGHVDWVAASSARGGGCLDHGDTPVFPGIYESAAAVAGTALDALARVMAGECRRSFQPVGGLHHARADRAAGFCVFNDLALVIRSLREVHRVRRIAYVDIDVHHGDGVFYAFEDDPDVIIADIHEDGRYLYPGTGHAYETGTGRARGTKLNLPLPPGAGDREFAAAWAKVLEHLRQQQPEFIVLQCGVDGLGGDPLGHLQLTPAAHAFATRTLCRLADEYCDGRLMAFGGGGYCLENVAAGWCAVLRELVQAP
jgi:acetoin utilization protein AcuC